MAYSEPRWPLWRRESERESLVASWTWVGGTALGGHWHVFCSLYTQIALYNTILRVQQQFLHVPYRYNDVMQSRQDKTPEVFGSVAFKAYTGPPVIYIRNAVTRSME